MSLKNLRELDRTVNREKRANVQNNYININQSHSGTGDNVAGDKTINIGTYFYNNPENNEVKSEEE